MFSIDYPFPQLEPGIYIFFFLPNCIKIGSIMYILEIYSVHVCERQQRSDENSAVCTGPNRTESNDQSNLGLQLAFVRPEFITVMMNVINTTSTIRGC